MSYINEEYAYSKKEIDLLKQHNEELEDTLTQLQETLVDKETAFQEELENIENIATQKLNNMKEEFVKKQQLLEKKCSQHSNANNNIENMIECFTTIEECEQYENQLKQNIESVSKRKVSNIMNNN